MWLKRQKPQKLGYARQHQRDNIKTIVLVIWENSDVYSFKNGYWATWCDCYGGYSVGIMLIGDGSTDKDSLTLSELINAINNGEIAEFEIIDDGGKQSLNATHQNGDVLTLRLREKEENVPSLLMAHGANSEQINTIRFRYSGTSDCANFPLIIFGAGFVYYGIVLIVLFQLRKRPLDDTARAIWALVILTVPILGLLAYVLATHSINAQPSQMELIN